MKNIIILLVICTALHTKEYKFPYYAFCHVPVADLFSVPPTQKYAAFAIPWDEKIPPASFYPRISQLLFNEQVKVLEEKNHYARVEIFHLFYIPHDSSNTVSTYWVKSDTLTPCTPTTALFLPPALSFKNHNLYHPQVATLTAPYTINGVTYSAGTRFVKSDIQKNHNAIDVILYNPSNDKTFHAFIDSSCVHIHQCFSSQEKRSLFLSLIKKWTSSSSHFFPYVLGGASLTSTYSDTHPFYTTDVSLLKEKKTFYYRENPKKKCQAQGIDCSHLIARAAHIAQIPLFARNTVTFMRSYPKLTKNQTLHNGDLIVWKGHMCIVSDIEKNLIIEARGYSSGYGKVHESQLQDIFKNIKSYPDLLQAYYEDKPLIRINKNKEVISTVKDFVIIPLIQ